MYRLIEQLRQIPLQDLENLLQAYRLKQIYLNRQAERATMESTYNELKINKEKFLGARAQYQEEEKLSDFEKQLKGKEEALQDLQKKIELLIQPIEALEHQLHELSVSLPPPVIDDLLAQAETFGTELFVTIQRHQVEAKRAQKEKQREKKGGSIHSDDLGSVFKSDVRVEWIPQDSPYEQAELKKIELLAELYRFIPPKVYSETRVDPQSQLHDLSQAMHIKLYQTLDEEAKGLEDRDSESKVEKKASPVLRDVSWVGSEDSPDKSEVSPVGSEVSWAEEGISPKATQAYGMEEEDLRGDISFIEQRLIDIVIRLKKFFINQDINGLLLSLTQLGEVLTKQTPSEQCLSQLQIGSRLDKVNKQDLFAFLNGVSALIPESPPEGLGSDVKNKIISGGDFLKKVYAPAKVKSSVNPVYTKASVAQAHAYFKMDLVPNTPNRRRLDQDIHLLRTHVPSGSSSEAKETAIVLAEKLQTFSDNYHKGNKIKPEKGGYVLDSDAMTSLANTLETESNTAAQEARNVLKVNRNSRAWSACRKVLITMGIISMAAKALYSRVTTGKWSIWNDITKSEGNVNSALASVAEIKTAANEKNKPKKPPPEFVVRKVY